MFPPALVDRQRAAPDPNLVYLRQSVATNLWSLCPCGEPTSILL